MPYRLLEDAPTSDIGFCASGATLEECFAAAVEATLAITLGNPHALRLRERRAVHVESEALDLLLLRLLEELIYYKDTESLFVRATHVSVGNVAGAWHVDATLEGEPIDPTVHQLSADVKAVTLHRLSVQRTSSGWDATVVLDV